MMHPEAITVADELLRYPSCLIFTHVNPEGDAIGSMLALALALEQKGITVQCFDKDGVPANNAFLPTAARVLTSLPEVIPPLVVFVDAHKIERCGVSREQLEGAQSIVRIDHHISEGDDIGLALVDTEAAAAGELVFEVIARLGAELTPEIATCLMTALMVDSGRFSYSNTTPNTHHIAAALLAAGADTQLISKEIWGCLPVPTLILLGRAMTALQLTSNGRVAWSFLRSADYKETGAREEDTEGIIDHVRCAMGTTVAVLFTERNNVVRVSLRSQGTVDVAALARQFGGGGHVKAAGITMDMPLDDAIAKVLAAIDDALGQ